MQINYRDKSILEHMIKYCEEIESYILRFGDSKEQFKKDNAYRGACSLDILQIGELSAGLTDEFKSQTTEMPWRDIKSMRNVVDHGYGTLDIDTTWDTIKEDIPILKQFCVDKLNSVPEAANA